ncbi:MAG: hypothetical protein AAGA84_09715 [Pseudomonadota bacterium]
MRTQNRLASVRLEEVLLCIAAGFVLSACATPRLDDIQAPEVKVRIQDPVSAHNPPFPMIAGRGTDARVVRERFGCDGLTTFQTDYFSRPTHYMPALENRLGLPVGFFEINNDRDAEQYVMVRPGQEPKFSISVLDDSGIRSVTIQVAERFEGSVLNSLTDSGLSVSSALAHGIIISQETGTHAFGTADISIATVAFIEPVVQHSLQVTIENWTSPLIFITAQDFLGNEQRATVRWLPSDYCLSRSER